MGILFKLNEILKSEKPTEKQLNFIRQIEKKNQKVFKGETKKEACDYIFGFIRQVKVS